MKVNYKINVLIDEYEYILKRTPKESNINEYIIHNVKEKIKKILRKNNFSCNGITAYIDGEEVSGKIMPKTYNLIIEFGINDSVVINNILTINKTNVINIENIIFHDASNKISKLYEDPCLENVSIIVENNGIDWEIIE